MIKITEDVSISNDELKFTASKSSGPGGQNVNKVNTRITLWFDVAGSASLSDDQKSQIQNFLSKRMSQTGILRIIAQTSRSQSANKEIAIERLVKLLKAVLQVSPYRVRTKTPHRIRQKRLEEKKHRSRVKKMRSQGDLSTE